MGKKVFWCKSCLNMSTRNRIEFDSEGNCNACTWKTEKETMDWGPRQEELKALLDKHRSKDGSFDCIVPVSGGKDGSYIAYNLKHKYGMNPLTVTVRPPLELDLGKQNLHNFINSGYDHIHITPNQEVTREFNRRGFIEKGRPYFGWISAMQAAVVNLASNIGVSLIFYGEDGEIEYGGSTATKNIALYDVKHMKSVFLEGDYDDLITSEFSKKDLNFWQFPSDEKLSTNPISITHWSYFEPWDSYRNYLIAKEHCGLQENEDANSGTFTNFAQNDQALYSLHAYLMYIKFGFGRATQDAGIEIRRGAMTRDQAINLVKMYDNQFPENFIDLYLEYFKMTREEFDKVIDTHANKDLFEKVDGYWEPKFTPGEDFECN